ncbi:hypothetical protein GCM10020366_11490 [Saccharopolyspora gregorii]|uniref:Uncharacterized protein n=1 Tax=Saccharopolyspora gregorii TaxID=33914 RepID=A0ABP6RKS7_9PSEU
MRWTLGTTEEQIEPCDDLDTDFILCVVTPQLLVVHLLKLGVFRALVDAFELHGGEIMPINLMRIMIYMLEK